MEKGMRGALLNEFHAWQDLGRGEIVWNEPVVPEPYFYPFFGHGALVDQPPLVENGRRDTVLSKWSAAIKAAFTTPAPPPLPTPEWEFLTPLQTKEAPNYLTDVRIDLRNSSWLLPADINWNPKEWEPLLYSLSGAEFPVCLEILATGGKIHFRWVVEERDRETLSDAMSAVEMGVQPQTDLLNEWMEGQNGGGIFWSRELALDKEFLFPIRSDFRSDPYEGILASLSRLKPDELGVIQILFSPCVNAWTESIWRSVVNESGQPFFEGGQPYLQTARHKCSHPLFAANVRLAVLSEDGTSSTAERLWRSFKCYDEANRFVLADPHEQDDEEGLGDLLLRRFRRSGMILNAAELFALVHPPSARVGSTALQRIVMNTRQVPYQHSGNSGLFLGSNEHAGESRKCHLNPEERSRHLHVLGASGTGKSTFLLHSMLQDLDSGNGFALLDPHGDLVEAVLDRLPENRIKDVVIFNPADTEFPVGFNILRAHTEIEKNLLASDFVAIFERLSSSWGDQMSAVLGNAALALLESEQGGTLIDLKRFLIEKRFRENFLQSVNDPEVVYFWKHEFPLLRGTTQGSLLTRLSGFLRHRLIRNMVSQKGERFDVAKMMAEGKIILAPLSQGLIGQENSWLLGSLLVSRFYQAALSRQSQDERDRRPFYLYLDEAHNFVTPSIASILSGTRKYGLGLVLAHQELDQFPTRESGILSSILTNCNTRVCFRLGDHDATRLETGFSHFEANDLRRLGTGEAVCRIGGSDSDFNIRTAPSPDKPAGFKERRERAIEHSRLSYARPREKVELPAQEFEMETSIPKAPTNRPDLETPKVRGPSSFEPRDDNQGSQKKTPSENFPPVDPNPPPTLSPTPVDTPVPVITESKPRTPGRGGSQHKHLQRVIKAHGNGLGLRATIEAELPEGQGCIDVLLENGNTRIAFEVAEKSPLEQELKNIRKCLEAQIPEIYVVSTEQGHLQKIQKAAEMEIGAENLTSVSFVNSSVLGEVFARIGARLANSEMTSRGFRVKVTYNPGEEGFREARTNEIHRAVAKQRESPPKSPE